jgi:hypothetical protein
LNTLPETMVVWAVKPKLNKNNAISSKAFFRFIYCG